MRTIGSALISSAAIALFPSNVTAGTKPCGREVMLDWQTGGISRTYAVACYISALHNLPDDVRVYSNAEDAIRGALLAAIRESPVRENAAATAGAGSAARSLQAEGRRRVAESIRTAARGATSPPAPILILAAVALILLIGGAVGRLR